MTATAESGKQGKRTTPAMAMDDPATNDVRKTSPTYATAAYCGRFPGETQ